MVAGCLSRWTALWHGSYKNRCLPFFNYGLALPAAIRHTYCPGEQPMLPADVASEISL